MMTTLISIRTSAIDIMIDILLALAVILIVPPLVTVFLLGIRNTLLAIIMVILVIIMLS